MTDAASLQQQEGPDAAAAQGAAAHDPPPASNTLAAELAASKTQERQQQANRLATAYRCAWQAACTTVSFVSNDFLNRHTCRCLGTHDSCLAYKHRASSAHLHTH